MSCVIGRSTFGTNPVCVECDPDCDCYVCVPRPDEATAIVRMQVGRMSKAKLNGILATEDDSSTWWTETGAELDKREDQRAANNGAMNGVAPEF